MTFIEMFQLIPQDTEFQLFFIKLFLVNFFYISQNFNKIELITFPLCLI